MKLMFIDYDSNRFKGDMSFPISVGYVVYDCDNMKEVEEGYYLIKPTEEWEGLEWNRVAETHRHNLSKELLREQGIEARKVADALVSVDCDLVVSDAVKHDKECNDLLLSAGNYPENSLKPMTGLEQYVPYDFWVDHGNYLYEDFTKYTSLEIARYSSELYRDYFIYQEAVEK